MSKPPYYLLKSRRFLPILIVQFLGAMNDNIYKNSLIILITFSLAQQLGWSPKMPLATALGLFILPFLLFSATAGELADRFDKERMIQWTKFAEIVILGIGATMAFYLQSIILMYIVLFLLGTHSAFFGPLKYSILPQHLTKNELLFGNAWIESSTFLAILLGTLLGGFFILKSYGVIFISILLITFALIGWLTSLFIPKAKSANPQLKVNYNFLQATNTIVKYALNHKPIFQSILGISWFWFIGASLLTIVPLFTKEILKSNETTTTLLLTFLTLGIGMGSIGCYSLLQEKLTAKFIPLAGLGISLFMLLMTISKPLAFAGALGIGVCGGFFIVPLYSLLQYNSNVQYRSRNIATNNIMGALFMIGASLLAMFIFQLKGGPITLLITIAILNVLFSLYIFCKIYKVTTLNTIVIFVKYFLKFIYRIKITGIENLPPRGKSAIIIANHISLLDPVLIRAFVSNHFIYPIDTETAQKWWVKLFLVFSKTICIDPQYPFSFKKLIKLVEHNEQILIFPEGRITITGTVMKIYDGAGYLAYKTDSPIIPILISGAKYSPFSYLRGKTKLHWFPKIRITIFPPKKIETPNLPARELRKYLSLQIYNLLTTLQVKTTDQENTLFKQLLLSGQQNGIGTVIMSDVQNKPLTYRKIIAKSLVLGKVLTKGLPPEKPIGLIMPTCNSVVLKFFGLQSTGHIAALLNYTSGPTNILRACQITNIECVWSSIEFITKAKLTSVVALLQANNIQVKFIENYKPIIKSLWLFYTFALLFPRQLGQQINKKNDTNAQSIATILFTSGSTGDPKGVAFSHKNFISNYFQANTIIDLNKNDKILSIMPVFHAFGLTAGILSPLFHGTRIFLYPTPLHYRAIPEVIYNKEITILFSTNTFLRGYSKYANAYDLRSVRYLFGGAEKIQENIRRIYEEKFGIRILEGYGTTEASPFISLNTPLYNKSGTVGKFLPGIEYKLQKIPHIHEGQELWIKGNNVMLGYICAQDSGTFKPIKNEWLNTGDIVTIDTEGFITIIGRTKRFAKIGGETIPLNRIEELANEIWPLLNNACISIPDEQKGEMLILITENQNATLNEFRQFAKNQGINPLWIPKSLKIVAKLPLLGSGKPDYTYLSAVMEKKVHI